MLTIGKMPDFRYAMVDEKKWLAILLMATLLTASPMVTAAAMNTRSMRWYEHKSGKDPAGAALVIHGLNLRPDKMESLIAVLNEAGYDALNLSLRGHGTNYLPHPGLDAATARLDALKTVTSDLWKAEALAACNRVQNRTARQNQAPLLVGCSMGALIGLDLFTSRADVRFDKLILLAPALKLHGHNHLIRLLAPFPCLVIPSPNSPAYLANRGTPMAAYNSFFQILAHFHEHLSARVNVPTITFIDPRDEIVSYDGLQDLVRESKLDRWQIHPVRKGAIRDQKILHHLVIDEPSTGEDAWQNMVELIRRYVLEK